MELDFNFFISFVTKSKEGWRKRIVVNEAVITFKAGMNLTADTAKREIKGKMASGVLPNKIRNAEIKATLNNAMTSKNNLGDPEIR